MSVAQTVQEVLRAVMCVALRHFAGELQSLQSGVLCEGKFADFARVQIGHANLPDQQKTALKVTSVCAVLDVT